jgi:predicted unusual protein kinase regulating ubiquinone biosynthesis (AarF/ABC1/UbiB family)
LYGAKVFRVLARFRCAGKLLYGDPHAGNFLFNPQGILGLIDLGCVRRIDREDWQWYLRVERALRGGADDIASARALVAARPGEVLEPDREDLLVALWRWMARAFRHEGPFDFGSDEYFREGTAALARVLGRRYLRGRPSAALEIRARMGAALVLHRLRARVDVRSIWEREQERALARGPAP